MVKRDYKYWKKYCLSSLDFDINDSDDIDATELNIAMRSLGFEASREEINKMILANTDHKFDNSALA